MTWGALKVLPLGNWPCYVLCALIRTSIYQLTGRQSQISMFSAFPSALVADCVPDTSTIRVSALMPASVSNGARYPAMRKIPSSALDSHMLWLGSHTINISSRIPIRTRWVDLPLSCSSPCLMRTHRLAHVQVYPQLSTPTQSSQRGTPQPVLCVQPAPTSSSFQKVQANCKKEKSVYLFTSPTYSPLITP